MARRRKDHRRRRPAQGLQLRSGSEEIEHGLLSTLRELASRILVAEWNREVDALCGPRWRPQKQRVGVRAGRCPIEIQLAGTSVALRRPRVRTTDGEVELESCRMAVENDLLAGEVLEAIVIGATTGYTPPLNGGARIGSFAESMANHLSGDMRRPLAELGGFLVFGELPLRRFGAIACVEIRADGERRLVTLRAGGTDSSYALEGLVAQVGSRLPSGYQPALVVVSGPEHVGSALRRMFGESIPIQRCPVESMRRVVGLLPPGAQPMAMEWIEAALELNDPDQVRSVLERIATQLESESEAAARTLRAVAVDLVERLRRIAEYVPGPSRRGDRGSSPTAG